MQLMQNTARWRSDWFWCINRHSWANSYLDPMVNKNWCNLGDQFWFKNLHASSEWKTVIWNVFEIENLNANSKDLGSTAGRWYPKNLHYYSDVKAWNEAIDKITPNNITFNFIFQFNQVCIEFEFDLTRTSFFPSYIQCAYF